MTLHSCAIWGVASRYGHACTTELTFLRDVLAEADGERVAHKVAGAYVCGYEIRPPQRSVDPRPARLGPPIPSLTVRTSSEGWSRRRSPESVEWE
jgi:hypothetical protein